MCFSSSAGLRRGLFWGECLGVAEWIGSQGSGPRACLRCSGGVREISKVVGDITWEHQDPESAAGGDGVTKENV